MSSAVIHTVKAEEGRPATAERPSAGPVFRCKYAVNGLLEPPPELQSPWQLFSEAAKQYPNCQMLGRRKVNDSKVGPYTWITYKEAYDAAIRVGSAIRSRGVEPGNCCGIYGSNCPEWIIAMEACMSQAITYVPLYETLGANAVEFIINHAEVSIVFVQEKKIPSILSCLPGCVFNLKTIVSFGNISSGQKEEAEKHRISLYSWQEFSLTGESEPELPRKQRSDVCTIMYTSGTTGEPKGVILNNSALLTQVLSIDKMLLVADRSCDSGDVFFSYLPLAHVYDQVMEIYFFSRGSSVGYWRGDIKYLIDDVQELKPTAFCGVPRVYDKIYAGVMQKISASGLLRKKLFEFAYNYKLGNMRKGLPQEEASPRLDRLVFDKIKEALGGRAHMLFSGAAPLPRHVEEFLRIIPGSNLSQGYGLTESCGGSFTTLAGIFSMVSTVGVPMPTVEARLVSVPEMGYDAFSTDDVPRGEICLRGTSMFSGYHKREDLTDQVLIDGWFHTGDIGEWQEDGSMKIIDRKKNIFKLSQGEYIAVENLENTYSRCPLVAQIWVYGNSFESFLVGVVVPERQTLEDWTKLNNETPKDFESLCQNPKAKKYILDQLNSTAKQFQLKGFEMLKAVYLEPNPFDIEKDLITPTFKLKRPQLLNHYKDIIDRLYREAKGSRE
ncbi:PREDICTED: long chain acyl-CoA synthetase 2 [Tarenaya hassleriana]|uniref:long chain acyl-CoA synthetase 2 n=1 Tax=Tarenaya hassleriana TaxID=28532 RepID=UPI00053C922B|nr:PREDICTED: long chain acyl-CoA synthetase 2 [Tarenaya hassleriana]